MSRCRIFLVHVVITAVFAVQVARASIIPRLTFEQILHSADTVFTGTVVRVESKWTPTRSGAAIITLVTYRVERVFKGHPGNETTLEFLGGTIGDVTLEVVGVPKFAEGQHDVVCALDGTSRVSPITGFNQGRFRVIHDAANREVVTSHDGGPPPMASDVNRSAARGSGQLLTLPAFEREIVRVLQLPPR